MDDIQKVTVEAALAWTEYEPDEKTLKRAEAGKAFALVHLMQHAFQAGYMAALNDAKKGEIGGQS